MSGTGFAAFGLDPGEPVLVRRSWNEVLRARRNGAEVYLRVTPTDLREPREVEAETAWMAALVALGLPVAAPIAARHGGLVEPGSWRGRPASFICLAAAPGRPARKPDDFHPPVIDAWATLLGELHAHAAAGAPASQARPRWDDDRVTRTALAARDPAIAGARDRLGEIVAWMRALDPDPAGFGLTHADLQLGNLAVDGGGTVTAFDFDDACHHFFIHDVAVAVTSIRKAAWEYPGAFDAAAIERRFVARHRARHPLDPRWHARLPAFIAYRIALSICWANQSLAAGELDPDMTAWYHRSLPWWQAQLAHHADAIDAAMKI